MAELFASGRIADLIVLLTLAEGLLLSLYHRMTGRGLAPRQVISLLLPGIFLLLAMRFAMTGAWWGWVALCLSLALLAHLADLAARWRNWN